MSKTWRNGLQGRLKDAEDRLDLIEDGNLTTDIVGDLTGHLTDPDFVTPVEGVAATATVVYADGTAPTATKKVTIGGVVYTFVAVVAAAGNVAIGASADAAFTNLSRAINKSGGTEGAGQDYMSAGGIANPYVSSAVNTGTDTVTLTALLKGTAGNAITLTSDEATVTLSGVTLGAGAGVDGVNGTVGAKGDLRFDADFVYVCTAAAAITDSGKWKKAALSAL
jgi:hypothetical protein